MPSFLRLNHGWNADPNVPYETVHVRGDTVLLEFRLATGRGLVFAPRTQGRLTFPGCARHRLTSINDEGWYRVQCRYSRIAPAWGELYEVSGDLLDHLPADPQNTPWETLAPPGDAPLHRFLFYLRDNMFECDARAWRFDAATKDGSPFRAGSAT